MSSAEYGAVVFLSTNWAIRAENLALRAGLQVKLIPTPRHLSSDCGTALRFSWEDREELQALLAEKSIAVSDIARL